MIGGFTTLSLFGLGAGQANAQTFYDESQYANNTQGFAVGGAGTAQGEQGIMTVIKNFINYALGLLGLIALVMLIWGGYKMVTSAGQEDVYQDGLKILKNAAIGIGFIAVSWMLVSFVFFVIGKAVGA